MKIEKNTVATFHYQLREADSETNLETSREGDPVACLIGHGNIIQGLENSLHGKETGDVFSVTVEPQDAYGERNEGAKQRIPIKHLLTKGKLRPGMVAHVQTEHGARQVVIEKVGKFNVDVDVNHPLAGKRLVFAIEIMDVRKAAPEEISHGHAHGPGGHHHH